MRRMKWAGYVARIGGKRNAYKLLVRKQDGKRPLGRPSRSWVDNTKLDLVDFCLTRDKGNWRALANANAAVCKSYR
jgi:hypothetical protein